MLALDATDMVLLAVAGFIAVTTLVKLMQARRDRLMKKLRRDFDVEQERLQQDEKKQRKKEQHEAEKAA